MSGKVRGGQLVDDDMQIVIWSDVACPGCYVGTALFERAVAETGLDVDVVYRSFELDPSVPRGEEGPPLVDYLAKKFGDADRVRAAHARLEEAASELDIEFGWSKMRRANTFDAHRLLAWALRTGGAEQPRALTQALLKAYFTAGADLTAAAVLARSEKRRVGRECVQTG